MENKTYIIDNTNYLTLDGSPSTIKILEGHGYLFLVKKLADGRSGARNEITHYEPGQEFLNIKGNNKYDFILAGINGTKIQLSECKNKDFQQQSEELSSKYIADFENKTGWDNLRSIKQQKLADSAFSDALQNISSVVKKSSDVNNFYKSDDFPIVKVFKTVANSMGITNIITIPDKAYEANKTGVQQLAKDNTTRVREVVLRGNWYKEDNGHLIAFYNPKEEIEFSQESDVYETLIPIALIKNKAQNG